MAERKEWEELKPVTSLKDVEEGLPVKLDLDQDAWEFGPPPPKNAYKMKIFLARDGYKAAQLSENSRDVFYQANLECRIVSDNPDYDGIPVFTRVDTRIYRGKDISTMAGLIVALGYKGNLAKEASQITPLRLCKFLEAALKKEPIGVGEVDWRGSYQFTNAKGEQDWANPLRKYEDFPMLPDGSGRDHHTTITDKVSGNVFEVRAQSFISRWFGKDDHVPTYNNAGIVKELKGTAPVTPQLVRPVAMPSPSPVAASPLVAASPIIIPARSLVTPTDSQEDINLLLES